MSKKITSLILCIVLPFLAFSGCGQKEKGNVIPLPVADANPNISNPKGEFYEIGGELKADGGLSVLGTDFLKLMIEGEEWEFALSPEVIRKIEVFNKDKDNLLIKRGSMLSLTYEKQDLIFVATDIEIINAN